MKRTKLAVLIFFCIPLAACVPVEDKDKPGDPDPECVAPADCEEREQEDAPDIKGVFVSGHLGNYRDCPSDGYSPGDADGAAPAEGDAALGACAEGTECNYILNCEDAQATIKLTNGGLGAALGVQVIEVELLDADGVSRAVLPIESTVDVDSNEAFAGTLSAGGDATLRVTFLGPVDPYTLLAVEGADADRIGYGYGGILRITISSENHDDVVVESSEIFGVPSVDT